MTSRQRWTLVCTVIGSGAVFLDGTIVNAALKHIGQELPGSIVGVLEGQAYIVGGYLAVLAALLILAGALSDHYGRRRVYAIGLVGFAATSALCGLAPTLEWLILFRLAQGAAGALLIPGSLALITHAFDGPQRGRAFGIWAASTSALSVLGPIAGGTFVDTIGWRGAFLINVPLLGFALWATLTHVQESRNTETTGRFDWLGALVAALAVGGLAFGVIRGQANAWADAAAWIAIAIGVVALILFPILMSRRPDPLVPLDLFRSRSFAAVNLATFFVYGGLYVTFFYQAVVLQGVLGYTALGAGLVGVPIGIMLATLSTRVGTIAGRMGSRRFLVTGPPARERLASFGDRIEYVVADLGKPLPLAEPVDAVLSTATFHWVPDHDALFANLAAVIRPGGRLVAQCGGVGNIASVKRVLATIGDGWLGPAHYETPMATVRRLDASGFVDIECWLRDEPTWLEPGEPLETFLRTVILGAHLERLPAEDRGAFVHEVAARLPEPLIDYVRLNIVARRSSR